MLNQINKVKAMTLASIECGHVKPITNQNMLLIGGLHLFAS